MRVWMVVIRVDSHLGECEWWCWWVSGCCGWLQRCVVYSNIVTEEDLVIEKFDGIKNFCCIYSENRFMLWWMYSDAYIVSRSSKIDNRKSNSDNRKSNSNNRILSCLALHFIVSWSWCALGITKQVQLIIFQLASCFTLLFHDLARVSSQPFHTSALVSVC